MIPIAPGTPEPLGVSLTATGVNVAVASAHATAIEFCLFAGETEQRFVLPARTGPVFHGHFEGIGEGARYGLRAHGRFAPGDGHRFNAAKLLLDPWALDIDRPLRLHDSMFTRGEDGAAFNDDDSAAHMAKAIVTQPVRAKTGAQLTPMAESVLYELHVRGFTMRHPAIPPEWRGTFRGLAHPASIAHLQRLGITAVELLPVAAWIEERHLPPLGLTNYWGYNPIGWMAPDPRLAPGGWAEVRESVAALAECGIETILDVVYNHSGEGDALGPTMSLRGLDNWSYYRIHDGTYVNDSGCGNTLALDHPFAIRLAMDSLRAWAEYGGVHGFRFDLAPVLGRRRHGFDANAPMLAAIAQDPVLRTRKLIAEPWDIGPGGYLVGHFPEPWAEWNDRFRDDVRRFWQGTGTRGDLATRLAGSADLFGAAARPARGVNFVVAHDGFTLADLVSYAAKHNEANGEQNRDGTGSNWSWNNGAEGPSNDPTIRAARRADQKALLATLLLARGTPMLVQGSELGQTQHGNNNAYCQDNETTWLDWDSADQDLIDFTARLIDIRRTHAALWEDRFLSGAPHEAAAPPDVMWLGEHGDELHGEAWNTSPGHVLGMLLTRPGGRIAVLFNRAHAPSRLTLPAPTSGSAWHDQLATGETDGTIELPARGVAVLAEAPTTRRPATQGTDPALLDTLAAAAGIDHDWWEVDGTHHRVSPESLRALLTAMRLPADTTARARDSLARIAAQRDHRPLPASLVRRTGDPLSVVLPVEPGLSPRPAWLHIETEDGATQHLRAGMHHGTLTPRRAADGRAFGAWDIPLPKLPIGRHRLWRDDAAETLCHITIAPRACHLPEALARGERRFGIAAQSYTLRRDTDQGIGDFTTLARLAEATAAAGGAVLALNPLHALFPQQRHRASPYHPSDRRFLDPIHIDVSAIGPVPDTTALRVRPDVDYEAVWQLKSSVLESAWRETPPPDLNAFIAEGGPDLHLFAVFQTIAEHHPNTWWRHWPDGLDDATSSAVAAFATHHAARVRYHQCLQYLADRQFAAAAGRLEIGFIRDLAVGCAPDGAEAWAGAGRLGHGASVGAPPDPFSAEGQVWALPPPLPLDMQAEGYAGFSRLLAANLRHAGGLRIDHVMGLARLFWVPEGARGADGAYVRYPMRDLMGHVALESVRAKALIVGEDLGTVPEGLREAMADHAILGYRVLLLEREGTGFKGTAAYPRLALASVSTHDLPTFAGWLAGADIAERSELGLAAGDPATRPAEIAALAAVTTPGDPTSAAHAFIGTTPACLALVQADDLAGETRAVNLPGTDTERPNWRRRLAPDIGSLLTSPLARTLLTAIGAARTSAPLAPPHPNV